MSFPSTSEEDNGRVDITEKGLEVPKVSVEFKQIPLDKKTKSQSLAKLSARINQALV